MAATVADREARWDPKREFETAIQALRAYQNSSWRNVEMERAFADEASKFLHSQDNQDFMICAEVRASSAFWGRYLPKSWLDNRPDFRQIARKICGTDEAADSIEKRGPSVVKTYFQGFYLGTDLGYPEQMGEKWHLYLSDESGSFYVPVEAVDQVISISF
jgi:hypothetical protein